MVVDMVRIMNTRASFCNELPNALIVGIGYPNGETLTEKHAYIPNNTHCAGRGSCVSSRFGRGFTLR